MHKVGAGSMVRWSNAGTSSESSTAPAADTLDEPAMVFPAVPIRDEIWPLNNESEAQTRQERRTMKYVRRDCD